MIRSLNVIILSIVYVGLLKGQPLLDEVQLAQLQLEPYKEWFHDGFEAYQTGADAIKNLKSSRKDFTYEIYFGTWCGDSRREVPRFLKMLDDIGVMESRIKLIALDREDGVYKQSPSKYEKDLGIYRVPTFRVLKNGNEVGRIVEYPVESLEADLLSVVEGKAYTPNYHTFPVIDDWLEQGLMSGPNTSIRGLANQLRPHVFHFTELNSVAHVLMDQGKTLEALKVYRMNAYLFNDNATCLVMLARAYNKLGKLDKALNVYKEAWKLEPGDEDIFTEMMEVASSS